MKPGDRDRELMLLVQRGDPGAFGALYDRLIPGASLVARAMVNPNRVEDVLQEAFLSVWRSRSMYRGERGQVHAWVFSIVRHRAIDSLREHGRHDLARIGSDDLIESIPALGDIQTDAVQHDEARALRSVLSELPLAQREVIALAYFGKLTHREIARGLGMPLGTVKGRMRLGLNRLREQVAA